MFGADYFLTDSRLAEVYTLPDCDNIIEKIESFRPSIILMDNKIPSIGGVAATRTIKSHPEHSKIPVVYFTAHNDIHTLANDAGADFVLQKPFSITQLESVVNQAFDTVVA